MHKLLLRHHAKLLLLLLLLPRPILLLLSASAVCATAAKASAAAFASPATALASASAKAVGELVVRAVLGARVRLGMGESNFSNDAWEDCLTLTSVAAVHGVGPHDHELVALLRVVASSAVVAVFNVPAVGLAIVPIL